MRKPYSIQPEVLYSRKGFEYGDQSVTILNNTYRNSGNVCYDYLDVPIMVRVRAAGIFFEAGPQYSYLMNVSTNRAQTLNGNTVSNIGSGTTDLSNVHRSELGYAAGLGFQASNGFIIGVRYNGASTDFAKNSFTTPATRPSRPTWVCCQAATNSLFTTCGSRLPTGQAAFFAGYRAFYPPG